MVADPRRLRESFDAVADLYDRARPHYPPALVDDLVRLCDIGLGAEVVEIGPGTGQLTAALAERGCRIVAVELGERLAARARRNLSRFSRVRVEVGAFEDWSTGGGFDAVVAATSFHWLNPAVRVGKVAAVLRPGGTFATVATHHVAGGTADFFAEAQACYRRWDPTTPPDLRLPTPDQVPRDSELDGYPGFEPAIFRRYIEDIRYTTESYLDTLRTYSPTRALSVAARKGLLRCLGELIDTGYGGAITKRYLFEVRIARHTPR